MPLIVRMSRIFTVITAESVTTFDDEARRLVDGHGVAYTAEMQAELFRRLLPAMGHRVRNTWIENVLSGVVGLPGAAATGSWILPSARVASRTRQTIYGSLATV